MLSKTCAGRKKGELYSPLSITSPTRSTTLPSCPPSCTSKQHYILCVGDKCDDIEGTELTKARALKGHFSALEEASDEPGVNEARGYACEFVAWQFLTSLKEADMIDFLLVELPPAANSITPDTNNGLGLDENGRGSTYPSERSPLLTTSNTDYFDHGDATKSRFSSLMSQCENLSALELATVSGTYLYLTLLLLQILSSYRCEEVPLPETSAKYYKWPVEG